jgi:hypothetical protein
MNRETEKLQPRGGNHTSVSCTQIRAHSRNSCKASFFTPNSGQFRPIPTNSNLKKYLFSAPHDRAKPLAKAGRHRSASFDVQRSAFGVRCFSSAFILPSTFPRSEFRVPRWSNRNLLIFKRHRARSCQIVYGGGRALSPLSSALRPPPSVRRPPPSVLCLLPSAPLFQPLPPPTVLAPKRGARPTKSIFHKKPETESTNHLSKHVTLNPFNSFNLITHLTDPRTFPSTFRGRLPTLNLETEP